MERLAAYYGTAGGLELHFSGSEFGENRSFFKNLLVPIFLQGIFKRENGPLRYSGKRLIEVAKRSIEEGKRPINANGQFSGTLPWWKTAPEEVYDFCGISVTSIRISASENMFQTLADGHSIRRHAIPPTKCQLT